MKNEFGKVLKRIVIENGAECLRENRAIGFLADYASDMKKDTRLFQIAKSLGIVDSLYYAVTRKQKSDMKSIRNQCIGELEEETGMRTEVAETVIDNILYAFGVELKNVNSVEVVKHSESKVEAVQQKERDRETNINDTKSHSGGWLRIAIVVAIIIAGLGLYNANSKNSDNKATNDNGGGKISVDSGENVPEVEPINQSVESSPIGTGGSLTDIVDPGPSVRTLIIEPVQYDNLEVEDVYVGETISISEEPVVSYAGAINVEDAKDIYSFVAPRDGMYSFVLDGVNANATIRLRVWDSKRNSIVDTTSNAYSRALIAGEIYEIQVGQNRDFSSYVLNIYSQKETRDITNATKICDQVSFEDQRNVYLFTAPITGRYRFEFSDINANTAFRMMMWDKYDNKIMDSYSGGGYEDLEGGETYRMEVRQNRGTGSYTLNVFHQKKTQDITNYRVVKDSIQYEDQRNIYTFTAPFKGRYDFALTEKNANTGFRMILRDKFENVVMESYSDEDYTDLEEGESYELQIKQNKGLGSYSLVIGYQKENVDVSNVDIVYDSITFNDQINEYTFRPATSRKYTFRIEDYVASCKFRLKVYDEYDNNIINTYNHEGEESLVAGSTYKIRIYQDSGDGPYSLHID